MSPARTSFATTQVRSARNWPSQCPAPPLPCTNSSTAPLAVGMPRTRPRSSDQACRPPFAAPTRRPTRGGERTEGATGEVLGLGLCPALGPAPAQVGCWRTPPGLVAAGGGQHKSTSGRRRCLGAAVSATGAVSHCSGVSPVPHGMWQLGPAGGLPAAVTCGRTWLRRPAVCRRRTEGPDRHVGGPAATGSRRPTTAARHDLLASAGWASSDPSARTRRRLSWPRRSTFVAPHSSRNLPATTGI